MQNCCNCNVRFGSHDSSLLIFWEEKRTRAKRQKCAVLYPCPPFLAMKTLLLCINGPCPLRRILINYSQYRKHVAA
ncbi:hypothetical protein FC91_GL001103 [Schleiferilactobacillus harbinensis DSM 16991]|uniref:Uncharacterized protein n=1 Tax=Schleiferilactobacillus harbinensis DSM 16991 TaxID=1122147 RepID=A0A0R1X5Z2_9LACO|nr:hypothetical protein FC91_GL001103 [Schleiferilactobacillus harbinensis DSM 16991]